MVQGDLWLQEGSCFLGYKGKSHWNGNGVAILDLAKPRVIMKDSWFWMLTCWLIRARHLHIVVVFFSMDFRKKKRKLSSQLFGNNIQLHPMKVATRNRISGERNYLLKRKSDFCFLFCFRFDSVLFVFFSFPPVLSFRRCVFSVFTSAKPRLATGIPQKRKYWIILNCYLFEQPKT